MFLPNLQGFVWFTLEDKSCYWKPLDDATCELVDKLCTLGYEHTLELEFRLESVDFNPNLDFRYFLPKFREKACVRVVVTSSGKVLDITVRFFSRPISFCEISPHFLGRRTARGTVLRRWKQIPVLEVCRRAIYRVEKLYAVAYG